MQNPDKARPHVERLIQNPDELELIVAEHMMFRQAIENSPLAISLFDKNDQIILWNDAYRILHSQAFETGAEKLEAGTLTAKDIYGENLTTHLGASSLPACKFSSKRSGADSPNLQVEKQYEGRGWYRVTGYLTPSGASAVISTDINILKRREKELKQAQSNEEAAKTKFIEAISILDDGFVIFDENDRLLVCNEAFKAQFHPHQHLIQHGRSYREITLQLAHSGVIPGIEGKEEEFVDGLVKKRQSEEGFANTFQRQDGVWIRQRDKRTPTGDLVGIRTDITALKNAEKESSTRENLINSVLNAATNGILVTEKYNGVIVCNDACCDIFNFDREKISKGAKYEELLEQLYDGERICSSILGKMSKPDFLEHAMQVTRSAEIKPQTLLIADGRIFRYRTNPMPNGIIVHNYVDITAEKQQLAEIEKTKEASELNSQRLEEITDAMAQGIIVFEDAKVSMFNDTALKMIGFPENEPIIGMSVEKFFEIQLALGEFDNIDKAEQLIAANIANVRANKSFHAERQTMRGVHLKVDGVTKNGSRLVITLTDITEQRQRELEIEKSSDFLQETTDAMAQGLVVISDATIQMFNRKALEHFGMDEEDIYQGQSIEEHFRSRLEKGAFGDKADGEIFIKNQIERIELRKPYQYEFLTHEGKSLKIDGAPNNDGGMVVTISDMTELKEREAEVEKTSRVLIETTHAMKQGMLVLDEGSIEFFNDYVCQLISPDDDTITLGTCWLDLTETLHTRGYFGEGEEGQNIYQKTVSSYLERVPHEIEHETNSGLVIRSNAIPSGDKGWIYTFSDITKTKRTENEAKRNHNLLLETTEAMTQGMLILTNNKVEFFNTRAKDILNVPEDIFHVGANWSNYFKFQRDRGDFGSGEEARKIFETVVEGVTNRTAFKLERAHRDKKRLKVEGAPNGKLGYLVTLTDVTDERMRDDEIRKTSELLRDSTDTMSQGIVVFGKKSIKMVNERARELLNVPDDVLKIGNPWESFIEYVHERGEYGDGKEADRKLANIKKLIKDRTPHNIERSTADGKVIKVDTSPSANGNWVVIYTDITDSKAREQRLENAMTSAKSAERAKSEFLANMSHEIRTPMNGVMGMAELLASTPLDPKQRMFTDVIVKSGSSLLTIINDILDFSKIDAGQMELDPAPFDLTEAIQDVATLVSSKVAQKDVALNVRVDPRLPKMMVGDVGRIRQIVTNLLGNAVKFTERGHVYIDVSGEVVKSDEGERANLKFRVKDSGIGIPQEQCEKVFQKFSQVDTSATRKHEGTGLGLSIASSLVELMGGEINVTSEVGKGSTFWFTASLPVHEEQSNAMQIPDDILGSRIMIVDGDTLSRDILTEQMAISQYDTAGASNGAEAIAIADVVSKSGIALDLIIMDYKLPDMSGADAISKIREKALLNDIPVLILTAVDTGQATQQMIELGVQGNLTKPTRSSLLQETVVKIISDHRARDNGAVAPLQLEVSSEPQSQILPPEPVAETQPAEPIMMAPTSELKPAPHSEVDATVQSDDVPTQELSTQADDNGKQDIEILVAEDNEVNQIVITQILESSQAAFEIFGNGRLAFEGFKLKRPRLILMDVSMPEMNGKEATQAIRLFEEENELPRTPIIAVTAHALKGDMEECYDAGMDDYLSKPVSPQTLLEKVDQWLERTAQEQVA